MVLEKAEEPEIKLLTSARSSKKKKKRAREMGIVLSYPVVKKALPDGASGKEPSCQFMLDLRDTESILGQEDTLEEGTAIHSSILAT